MGKKRTAQHYAITRTVYKAIKAYDHFAMEQFLTRVYTNGYEDGRKSVPGIDMKDVLAALGTVKGIGPATVKKVTAAIEEQFGGLKDGKEGDEGTVHKGQTEQAAD